MPSTAVADRLGTITIPSRFNGPPGSANGGFTCGIVAGWLAADPVEVTLRSPPPLEKRLDVESTGAGVALRDGDTLIADASPAELELALPEPPSLALASEAARAGYEGWSETHPFPTCFVCGPDRNPGDGLRIFPGRLPGSELWAADWTPDASLVHDGTVRADHVWAALDCPTSAPVANFGSGPPIVLGRLTATIHGDVEPERPHVMLSWPLGINGRKRESAAALFDSDGWRLAEARAVWIELRS